MRKYARAGCLVRLQDLLQGGCANARNLVKSAGHGVGNTVETNPVLEIQAYRRLIGASENGTGSATLRGRLPGQGQSGKGILIRRIKGQRSTGQQVQGWSRAGLAVWKRQGQLNGNPHIGRAELCQHGAVAILHQRVDNALPVHHHLHLRERQLI